METERGLRMVLEQNLDSQLSQFGISDGRDNRVVARDHFRNEMFTARRYEDTHAPSVHRIGIMLISAMGA